MIAEAPQLTKEQEFKRRCLTDTGFFARHVMGYDYDIADEVDPQTGGQKIINKGAGGIRATGPHAEMVAFVDAPDTKPVLMLAPRGSLKSTLLQSYAIRCVMREPTIRVLYGMDTYDRARMKLAGIKTALESNQRLIGLFGDQRGDTWGQAKFSVAGASPGAQEFTFQGFGPDKPATGGHFELIILDDLINHENCKTPDAIEKILRCFRQVSPLLVPGGKLIVTGTRYFTGDLYEYIITNLADHFRILSLDCGMEPYKDEATGTLKLKGAPRFAHQTERFLMRELAAGLSQFYSQYCNKVVSDAWQIFQREHFRPMRYDRDIMQTFTGYILTDTAVSQQKGACYSVIAYVLYDEQNNVYLADLRVGHFSVPEFVNHFFDVHQTWSARVFNRSQYWERIALNATFRVIIEDRAKALGIKLYPIDLQRTGVADQKEMRIRRLESRFQQGRFFVLDTVPRTFTDITKTRVLWDPEGYVDEAGQTHPDGELVTQFIRFPQYPFNDIPDALADMDAMDTSGRRIIGYATPHSYVVHKQRNGWDNRARWQKGASVTDLGVRPKPKRSSDPQDRQEWVDKMYADAAKRGLV